MSLHNFKRKCARCGDEYFSEDPDEYLCERCDHAMTETILSLRLMTIPPLTDKIQ